MDYNIFIAILGGLIHMILSLIIPSLLKDTHLPILTKIYTVYNTNKQLIITSSIIIALTIYITLSVGPSIDEVLSSVMRPSNIYNNDQIRYMNLSNLSCNNDDRYNNNTFNDNDNNFYNENRFDNNDNILKIYLSELSSDQ